MVSSLGVAALEKAALDAAFRFLSARLIDRALILLTSAER